MAVALVCPNCQKTSRTNRELGVGSKVRCAQCGTLSRCFIHGNGAIELGPSDPPPPPQGEDTPLRMPPRVGESEGAPRRTILTGRRKNRPIGGYHPFEKSRSYIGGFVVMALLGLGALVGYCYFSQVDSLNKAAERAGTVEGNAWRYRDAALHKQFAERQKRALAALKAREVATGANKAKDQKP